MDAHRDTAINVDVPVGNAVEGEMESGPLGLLDSHLDSSFDQHGTGRSQQPSSAPPPQS
jgi:hypothetical protein